jgi:ribosomal protein S13
MKKNYSRQIFVLLTRRVYKLSKKRKLGWSWNDAQRWVSQNLFKFYKGTPISKIKATQVDNLIISILDKKPIDFQKIPEPKFEICASPFDIPTSDLQDKNWWLFAEFVQTLDQNLKIRVAFQNIIDTGIIKKFELVNPKDIVEDLRLQNLGSDEMLIFKTMIAPSKKDDGKPCSYYLLITLLDSVYDIKGDEDEALKIVSESDLSADAKRKREVRLKEMQKLRAEREARQKAEGKVRPMVVEGKEAEDKKLAMETLKNLEKLYQSKLISKEFFEQALRELKQKLNKGGQI